MSVYCREFAPGTVRLTVVATWPVVTTVNNTGIIYILLFAVVKIKKNQMKHCNIFLIFDPNV